MTPESVALRALRTIAEMRPLAVCSDGDRKAAELADIARTALRLIDEAPVTAESAEQRAVPDGWTDDQMIRFGWLCVSGLSIKDKSLAERLEVFRDHEALRGVAAPAAQQASLVGLTPDEHRQIWIDVKGTLGGYGPPMEAAVRAFCQKNNLQLRDGGERG